MFAKDPMRLSRRRFLAAVAGPLLLRQGRDGPRRPLLLLPPPRQRGPGRVPSPAQLRWQRDELALFLHFGVNTFTDREWGDGREDPAIFAPSRLDARQWARMAKAAGFRSLILTAKHHDGFCLWPSATTRHSVAASPWREGAGDVVREFTDACRAEGLGAGLYLSPWDRNAAAYGSPRYNDLYCDQLTELLTRYGPVCEVWFDGANGEGPNGRRQEYDWARYWALVRRLQPQAVIFSDAGPDLRWIGNENGVAGETNWSTVDPAAVPFPGATGPGVTGMLQHGDPHGTVWRPGETDVSIRPGWFYHPAEDSRVKTADQLVDLYFTSVGRNSKLLLNVPPTREGLLHSTDVERLGAMRTRLAILFDRDLAPEVRAGREATVAIADLREDIAHGQSVARYTLHGRTGGGWQALSHGTTIGCRKLDRFQPARVSGVRLDVEEAVGESRPVTLGLY
jgi:alpha-L-fucosidase